MNRSGGAERQRCAREEKGYKEGADGIKDKTGKGTRDAGNERPKEREAARNERAR